MGEKELYIPLILRILTPQNKLVILVLRCDAVFVKYSSIKCVQREQAFVPAANTPWDTHITLCCAWITVLTPLHFQLLSNEHPGRLQVTAPGAAFLWTVWEEYIEFLFPNVYLPKLQAHVLGVLRQWIGYLRLPVSFLKII